MVLRGSRIHTRYPAVLAGPWADYAIVLGECAAMSRPSLVCASKMLASLPFSRNALPVLDLRPGTPAEGPGMFRIVDTRP